MGLVNRQISSEFLNMLYKETSFNASINTDNSSRWRWRANGLRVLALSDYGKHIEYRGNFANNIQNWNLLVSVDVIFKSAHPDPLKCCHLSQRGKGYQRVWQHLKEARNGVEDFAKFISKFSPAARNLTICLFSEPAWRCSSHFSKELVKFLLEPLKTLHKLECVSIEIPFQVQELFKKTVALTNTLSALIESDWKEVELEMTQDWCYLKEAARRSLFVPIKDTANMEQCLGQLPEDVSQISLQSPTSSITVS